MGFFSRVKVCVHFVPIELNDIYILGNATEFNISLFAGTCREVFKLT